MQRLVDNLRGQLEGFVEQRDDLILLVRCTHPDAAITLKLLSDVEEANNTDLFLLFSIDFKDADSFVTEAIEKLEQQYEAACAAVKAEGKEPLPPIPTRLTLGAGDARRPDERLKEAIAFSRGLLPQKGGHRLVWAMFPMEIADPLAYRQLWTSLAPGRELAPWMRGVRLLFREDAQALPNVPKLSRVRECRPDFSPEQLALAMQEETQDESLPEPRRMQSLLQLACLDYAHGRTEAAIGKYQTLLAYYKKTNDLTLQAFVLNSLGDIFQKFGDLEEAQRWYEFAVTPLVASGANASPVVFAIVVKNLADVSYHTGRYQDAEQYFDGWQKLAGQLDPESRSRALEWRGLSQEKQGDLPKATESWTEAAVLCREYRLVGFLKQHLQHLQRAYRAQEQWGDLDRVTRELESMES